MRTFYYTLELLLYFTAMGIIFYIDWMYGLATVMLIIADNLKTRRMMKEEGNKYSEKPTLYK
jgi:hypothetical protein